MWLEIEWDVVLLYSYTIYEAWVRGKEMIIIIMYIFMPENSICNIYSGEAINILQESTINIFVKVKYVKEEEENAKKDRTKHI